jgi:hypothetical protein
VLYKRVYFLIIQELHMTDAPVRPPVKLSTPLLLADMDIVALDRRDGKYRVYHVTHGMLEYSDIPKLFHNSVDANSNLGRMAAKLDKTELAFNEAHIFAVVTRQDASGENTAQILVKADGKDDAVIVAGFIELDGIEQMSFITDMHSRLKPTHDAAYSVVDGVKRLTVKPTELHANDVVRMIRTLKQDARANMPEMAAIAVAFAARCG